MQRPDRKAEVSSISCSCFSQFEHDRPHAVACLVIKSVSNLFFLAKQRSFSVYVSEDGLQIMPISLKTNKQKTNLSLLSEKSSFLENKCSSWPQHHCSICSAKVAFRASWTYEMRLTTASFRSALLKNHGWRGGKQNHPSAACSHECCVLFPEARNSLADRNNSKPADTCITAIERTHLSGWGLTKHFPPLCPRRRRLETAFSSNTATVYIEHVQLRGTANHKEGSWHYLKPD